MSDGVGLHDRVHGVVDQLADARALGLGRQVIPAGAFGDPEDAFARVLVDVVEELLRAGTRARSSASELGADLVAALGERVGDVLEEDQAEHEVLVLGGVHRAAELVGRPPEHGVQLGRGLGARQRRLVVLLPRWHYSSCPLSSLLVRVSVPSMRPPMVAACSSSSTSSSFLARSRRASIPVRSWSSAADLVRREQEHPLVFQGAARADGTSRAGARAVSK